MSDVLHELVLPKLEGVRASGSGYVALCPAHDDRNPSLSVSVGEKQPVVLNCQAGCDGDAILTALGLSWEQLCAPRELEQRAVVVTAYHYRDEHGNVEYVKERYQPKDFRIKRPDGHGGWVHKGIFQGPNAARRVLYQLPEVLAGIADRRTIFLCEGEKDVRAAEAAGAVATCNHEGASKAGQRSKWRPEYGDILKGADVVIVADNDDAGRAHARAAYDDLKHKAASVRIVRGVVGAEHADLFDHLAAGHGLDDLVPLDDDCDPSVSHTDEHAISAGRRVRLTPASEIALPSATGRRTSGDRVIEIPEGDLCSRCDMHTVACTCPGGPTRGDVWETPSPLGAQSTRPAFPTDALPGWLNDEVTELSDFTQTPYDLGATVALAVLSAAAGGRAVVEVRGSWREPLNLFLVVAMPPGSRKSAVFAELTAPLLDTEQTLIEKNRPLILEAETQRKIAERNAEKAANKASGADDAEAAAKLTAEAIDAAQMAEAITTPVMPRFVADDVTPEAATSLLAEQNGRLAVLSAEGGIFATMAGRYSGIPSFEVFLKGHAGDMLRVDRKGRPPEHIPHPALTLGLCVQPEVLRDIAGLPGFRGRGLLARILYSLPPNTVGHRKIGRPPVSEQVQHAYTESARAMVLTLAEWTDPAVLTLTPDAAQAVIDAETRLEPRLEPDTGDLAGIVDWAAKQVGAVVRIAGLLHLAENLTNGWGRPIEVDTMRRAIRIGDYYTAHAQATFDAMGIDPVLDDARTLLRWIERTRPEQFTRRQMHMGVSRSRFAKVGDLDAPLDLLEEHGYIRRAPEAERTGPGRRPSPAFLVHPDLATETT